MTIARILRSALTAEEKTAGKGRLLELWLEVGPACHLRCSFCFNANGGAKEKATGQELSIREYLDILAQFRVLGGLSVSLSGNGEPFHSLNLATTMAIVREAARLGTRLNIFTAVDLLTEELARELCDFDVSLSVKFNSFVPAIQNGLVGGSSGYTARRAKAIGILFRLGFNRPNAAGASVLSFVNSIIPRVNDREAPQLYRFCRDHGIVPDLDTLLPFGRAEPMLDEDIAVIDRVVFELHKIDEELGIDWPVDSFISYVGHSCDRCFYHLYIDYLGRASPCLGANKKEVIVGNVHEQSLAALWRTPLMRNVRARRYTGKCAACVKFLDGRCNSCLGRFAGRISVGGIETTGCWKFEER